MLNRLGRIETLWRFVQDAFIDGDVLMGALQPAEMKRLVAVVESLHLDFDDAYQYVAAERYSAILVSFDGDFDRTERGRKTPAELLVAK